MMQKMGLTCFRRESSSTLRLIAAALEKALRADLDSEGQRHLAAALEAFRTEAHARGVASLDAMRHRRPSTDAPPSDVEAA